MNDLYSEKDLQQLDAQLKKRYLILGAVLAVLLAVIVYSMVIRVEGLTMVSVFLCGAAAVFVIDMFCMPLHRYRRLVTDALTGRTHTGTLEFSGVEEGSFRVDGVNCRGLIFLGDPDKHGSREQRYYWDAELPLPDFRAGDLVTLKYTGKNIIGWEM